MRRYSFTIIHGQSSPSHGLLIIMLTKRTILFTLAIIFLIGFVVVVIVKKRAPVVVPTNAVVLLPSGEPYVPSSFQPFNPYPDDARFSIGTPTGSVSVRNFYPDAIDQEENSLVLYQREAYFIVYDMQNNGFWINISADIFDEERAKAEARLMTILDINQTEACRLDITVASTYTADPVLYRSPRKPSFCF